MKVYLIGNKDYRFYKIGVTKSEVKWRLEEIDSPRLPFPLEIFAQLEVGLAAHFVESQLHKFYKKRSLRGEWFGEIKPTEFVRKALSFLATYKPRAKRIRIDPYTGTRWGRRPSHERARITVSLQYMTVDEAKKLMAEEMKKENA